MYITSESLKVISGCEGVVELVECGEFCMGFLSVGVVLSIGAVVSTIQILPWTFFIVACYE